MAFRPKKSVREYLENQVASGESVSISSAVNEAIDKTRLTEEVETSPKRVGRPPIDPSGTRHKVMSFRPTSDVKEWLDGQVASGQAHSIATAIIDAIREVQRRDGDRPSKDARGRKPLDPEGPRTDRMAFRAKNEVYAYLQKQVDSGASTTLATAINDSISRLIVVENNLHIQQKLDLIIDLLTQENSTDETD